MPGLWDPHIHPLTLYQGGQYGQIAALMLSYGITSTLSVAGTPAPEHRDARGAGRRQPDRPAPVRVPAAVGRQPPVLQLRAHAARRRSPIWRSTRPRRWRSTS
ncbi:MAG: hypothetical protein MZW92_80900 [Comamonadaceae bacterium]|nr:hypothetical protein [Comamonadaceae bacterium]